MVSEVGSTHGRQAGSCRVHPLRHPCFVQHLESLASASVFEAGLWDEHWPRSPTRSTLCGELLLTSQDGVGLHVQLPRASICIPAPNSEPSMNEPRGKRSLN